MEKKVQQDTLKTSVQCVQRELFFQSVPTIKDFAPMKNANVEMVLEENSVKSIIIDKYYVDI